MTVKTNNTHMRRLLLLCFFMCTILGVWSQNTTTRSSLTLGTIHALAKQPAPDWIPVYITGDVPAIVQFLRDNGQQYHFTAGSIVSASLSPSGIRALNAAGIASCIDSPQGKGRLLNDVMVIHNNVDSAYYGYWPLPQGYDGTDVVIGIIDAPFDLDHGDFTNADGVSRIKYVWDQNLTGAPPAPFTYGYVCDSATIADGLCPSTDDDEQNYSHGSGVTGVAASSGLAANAYRGVAPNADLILVSLNFDDNFYTNLTDAIAFIYEKAAEMGKPCVINTSLGVYDGSHDGRDLTAQTINALIEAQPGRALVAAAGNAGNFAFHLGYTVTETPQFTWFKKLSYTNLVYFQVWADTADFNQVSFTLGADDPATWSSIGTTPVYSIPADFDFGGGLVDSVQYTIPGAGNVTFYAQELNGTYLIEGVVVPTVSTYYWRFTTFGTGHFDVYSMEATTGFSNYVTTGLPTTAQLPEIVNYRLPDTDQTTVGSWQCLDNVITVGSYTNRDTMTNFYGEIPPLTDVVGALFVSSSHGPTRDGRIKPDICAPGARVLSTASNTLTEWLISLDAANYTAQDGQHYLYNGTSFSSPAVAGIAALYFQKYPDATAAEVKAAILDQARQDAFTGAELPNNLWGYGKADAFRTLTGPWGCAPDDYTLPPQNPEVQILMPVKAKIGWDIIPNAAGYQVWYKPTGSPFSKIKAITNTRIISGLTPSTEYQVKIRAYCEGLGFSDFSETITFTTPPLKESTTVAETWINMYPNPANYTTTLEGIQAGAHVFVYALSGERLYATVTDDSQVLEIPVRNLPVGLYQVIISEPEHITTKTLQIVH